MCYWVNFQLHTSCDGLCVNHMLHGSLEMKYVILVQSYDQHRIRAHASVDKQGDYQIHAIHILDGHYSTVHTTSCANSLVHITTEILVVGI